MIRLTQLQNLGLQKGQITFKAIYTYHMLLKIFVPFLFIYVCNCTFYKTFFCISFKHKLYYFSSTHKTKDKLSTIQSTLSKSNSHWLHNHQSQRFILSHTVEPHYNEVLGTMKITLYPVSHYIRVKKQRNIKC